MTIDAAKLFSTKLGFDDELNRTYTNVYIIVADRSESLIDVSGASGLPTYGSSWTDGTNSDAWAFARTFDFDAINPDVKSSGDRIKYTATVGYTTKHGDRDPNDNKENPLNNAPVLSGSFIGEQQIVLQDADGEDVVSSTGRPLGSTLKKATDADSFSIQFNSATLDLSQRSRMTGKVNSTQIWGLPRRNLKLIQWDWKKEYAGTGFAYISNTLEFQVDTTVWTTGTYIQCSRTSPTGFFTLVSNNSYVRLEIANDLTSAVDVNTKGEEITDPINVKFDGTENTSSTKVYYLLIPVEEEVDFSQIAYLPTNLGSTFV